MKFDRNFLLALGVFLTLTCGQGNATEVSNTCYGNLETFEKKIIKAGVTYLIGYEVIGTLAKVRFAGREFDAEVKFDQYGTSWKGRWLTQMKDSIYFSFLPEDGGTLKFRFDQGTWFSGNCQI